MAKKTNLASQNPPEKNEKKKTKREGRKELQSEIELMSSRDISSEDKIKISLLVNEIKYLRDEKNAIMKAENEKKRELMELFKRNNLKQYGKGTIEVEYVESTIEAVIDSEALQQEAPDLFLAYMKTIQRREHFVIRDLPESDDKEAKYWFGL
ncbi:hypothetical protein [Methanolapillus millepedarum]|uniref:Uncharacterized protein n=1 Tax=Methanolapillus millepedarum TaxID=3028296 RepID=A0AA96ZUW8_9EURY|nr:hypothetical protein MsAc7_17830 [Methanosarcinaceae archaeon Ac7]